MEIFIKILTILGGITGLVLAFNTLISRKLDKDIKNYELYKSLKMLSSVEEPSSNLSEINVILNCITSINLTIDEVKWFIETPNAYKYIEQYGRLNRYIEVSNNKDSFIFKGKYKSKTKRNFEFCIFFLLYLSFGGLSVFLFLESITTNDSSTLPIHVTLCICSLILSMFFLIASTSFSECKKIIRDFNPRS
ncbi:hypothetical protein A9267_05710 [Shewanella sp. UCD-FRSSP16_17]|uniref:hypothetical protein n=1 Tax=Shewanella sp. UCD-FRSSP16_17 TaxID=1853256 RepID=UPI0007EEEE5E|nr:hypothetical protein [Shewanella sp. UCD-FRSSP16_17]OBT10373.1 hypothetical protein A9267_05710 [Shewanella sp. UCD-FRSSP16_17]